MKTLSPNTRIGCKFPSSVSQDCLLPPFLLLNPRARPKPAHPDSGLQRGTPHRTGAARLRAILREELFRQIPDRRRAQRLHGQHARRRPEGRGGFSRRPRRWNSSSPSARAARSSRVSSSSSHARFHRLRGRRRRDAAARVPGIGAPHGRCRLRCRLALAGGFGFASGADDDAEILQPRFSFHRPTAVPAEHPRHAMRREGDEARGRGKNPPDNLRIADMAFDINLLVAIKYAGFRIREVPTEWTDKAGSKVTSSLFRSSLTMFLSVVRVRLIYWPRVYKLAAPVAPAGRLDLQKTPRAAAVVRAKIQRRGW